MVCSLMGWTEQEYNSQRIEFVWDLIEEIKKNNTKK